VQKGEARVFHEFFRWLQEDLGAVLDLDRNVLEPSWSQELVGSLNIWALLEGTHVLTLMLFAGTILMVDLRMLGVAFRNVPYTRLNDRVLPLTVAGFAIMAVTGGLLFLAKPMDYYHNLWFRAKLIFLMVAAANIFWFHTHIQKSRAEWDTSPKPPRAVRLSATISLASWILVIVFGRLMAFPWFECSKPQPGFVNWFAECASTATGIITGEDSTEDDEGTYAASSPDEPPPDGPEHVETDAPDPGSPVQTEGN
jgi:hypothetical protein